MKVKWKKNEAATALLEPEDDPVSVVAPEKAEPESPSPAPAGALHRVSQQDHSPVEDLTTEEYTPQRGSYGMRLKGGLPRSLAGRILMGSAAFVLLAGAVLVFAAVRNFLLHDPRFTLLSSSSISVEGNAHIARADVLAVFGSDLERNIFRIPLGQRREDLQRLPWVAHATVERLLPNRIGVFLQERTPVAFVRQGSHIGLVDASGVLLDMPPESAGDPHYSFPVLTGLGANDDAETRAARMEVYRRFTGELAGDPKQLQSISEVDVTNPEDLKALVTGGGSDILVHFGDEHFLDRYRSFERHLPEWHTQYPKLAAADMRYERQVVLEMQGATPDPTPGSEDMSAKMHDPGPQKSVAPASVAAHKVNAAAHGAAGKSAANARLFRALAAHRESGSRTTGRR